jgi:heme-degrading monooxygenase HmoA
VIVRMWEAKVVPGRLDDAVDYLTEAVVPDARAAPGCLGAEAFRALGGEERVVLITRWEDEHAEDWAEGRPPERLWLRDHAWWFEPIPGDLPPP